MNTLETDIEIGADGSVRLLSPLPSWLRPGRTHVLLVADEKNGNGIEKTRDVCGGDACIAGTRVPVWTLEQSRRLGFSEEELLDAYPSPGARRSFRRVDLCEGESRRDRRRHP